MNKLILALTCAAVLSASGSAFAGGDAARGAELTKKYNCASCHGFHKILPSSDPKSTVNTKNLGQTCGQPPFGYCAAKT